MSEIEHFMTLLMDKEEEGTLSPILSHGGVRFMWIKHNNLYRILQRVVSCVSFVNALMFAAMQPHYTFI